MFKHNSSHFTRNHVHLGTCSYSTKIFFVKSIYIYSRQTYKKIYIMIQGSADDYMCDPIYINIRRAYNHLDSVHTDVFLDK